MSDVTRTEVEAALYRMYVNDEMTDEQMTFVAEQFPAFRLHKSESNGPSQRCFSISTKSLV